MIVKNSLKIIGCLAYVYGCIYLFNHFNAWVGIALFVGGLIILAQKLFNKINNNN